MNHAPISGPVGLFNVSHLPRFGIDSAKSGWSGAFLVDLVAHPFGTVEHEHGEFCLQLASGFKARPLTTRGDWRIVPRGAHILCPGDEQRYEWKGGGRRQFLFLRGTRVAEILGGQPATARFGGFRQEPRQSPAIDNIVQALLGDLVEGSPAGALVGDALIHALVCRLAAAPATRPAPGGLAPAARRRVLDYLDGHLAESVHLATLAALAGVSERQFYRAFQSSLGCSPHQFVLRQRVARAQALLAQDAAGLAEIAQACGFADQSQFTRVFRQHTGRTPGAYRVALRH